MNTILITGGAGFIGSNFVRTLVQDGRYSIVVLDALTYAGTLTSIESILDDNCQFVHGKDQLNDGIWDYRGECTVKYTVRLSV